MFAWVFRDEENDMYWVPAVPAGPDGVPYPLIGLGDGSEEREVAEFVALQSGRTLTLIQADNVKEVDQIVPEVVQETSENSPEILH